MFKSPVPLVIAASLATVFLTGCQGAEETIASVPKDVVRPAKLMEVQALNQQAIKQFPGVIEAANQTQLSFRVNGQINHLPIQAGQQVRQGDVLARLDTTDFDNNLNQAKANHQLAKVQYDQISQLYAKNYSSKTELEQATAQLKASQAALAMAEDSLSYTQLVAPMDGIIDRVNVENHQLVSPQFGVIQLRTMDDFDVRFDIPENLLTQVKQISNPQAICLNLRFNSRPNNLYPACYKESESSPDPTSRTYSMVFKVADIDDFVVLPGMTVTVLLDLTPVANNLLNGGVLVPPEALFEKQGLTYVWALDDTMRTIQTKVTTGKLTNEGIQITHGLNPGSRIIAAGVDYVQPGMQVRPYLKERGL